MSESPPGGPQIGARLRAVSEPATHAIDADTVIAAAHRRSRQRNRWSIASVATVLAVTAAIAIPLTVTGSRTTSADLSGPLPPAPAGSTDEEFRLAAPGAAEQVIGGLPPRTAACALNQITAVAMTRATVDGVLGVLRLRGAVISHSQGVAVRCALPLRHGPTALIDAAGHQLEVPLDAGDTTNPPSNPRSDIPLAGGDAIWGFAWLGSYCGPRAVTLQISLSGAARGQTVSAPLTGRQPTCTSGQSTSILIDGIAGAPGDPVQPPRPEYTSLRMTGQIQPGTSRTQLAPIDLTIRNAGESPVSLDPCPAYAGRDFATARSGGFGDPISQGYLPCTDRRIVIEPGQSYGYTVPATSLVQTPGTGAIPGSTVHVSVGIAGLPMLTLTTTAGSTSPSGDRAIILGSHGLGPVAFGTSKAAATSELTALLGPPSGHGPNTGCGPAFTEIDWSELAVEFHNNRFSGYRDINRPAGNLQLAPEDPAGYETFYPVLPNAKTGEGIGLGDSLGRLRAAYSKLTLAGADRWKAPDGISFVDNSLTTSPASPQARIIEIRIGTCGSY